MRSLGMMRQPPALFFSVSNAKKVLLINAIFVALMELYPIETGRFRLDGGAMFGVVPKVLWQRTNPADEYNRILMAMRALLVIENNRIVLIDNGIGHKYDEKFAKNYAIDHETYTLESSLHQIGVSLEDITDVVLTHLHFDHCGGTTALDNNGNPYIIFPNARIWVQKRHLAWALNPNPREKASFLKENIEPIARSEQLQLLDGETELFPGFSIKVVNGHTEAQQLPIIQYKDYTILYAADLFPTHGHIPLPYVMSYDVRPLITLQERQEFLPWIVNNNVILFYEHDPYYECGTVKINEKGKYQSDKTFPLKEITG